MNEYKIQAQKILNGCHPTVSLKPLTQPKQQKSWSKAKSMLVAELALLERQHEATFKAILAVREQREQEDKEIQTELESLKKDIADLKADIEKL